MRATTRAALLLARATYEASTFVARSRRLALPAARLRGHGVLVSTPGVEVLIEGYPRSANSFTVAAFARAQHWPGSGGGRIAHHTHAPAHVLEAIRRRVPAIVLIRDPAEAVLEFVLVKPDLTVRQALRGYVRFYEPLLPHRDGFVVGPFEEVTTDLGRVILRLNERFGTSFRPFEHTASEREQAEADADRSWARRTGPGIPILGRGGGTRSTPIAPERLRADYEDPLLERLRGRARTAFELLASGA